MNHNNKNLNKNDMRKLMLERRRTLTPVQVRDSSDRIFETLAGLRSVQDSRFILSYMPYGNEADVMPLNRWILAQGKGLCVPRVLNDHEMDAVGVDSLDRGFSKSRLGVLEPFKEKTPVNTDEIDLIIVPGLAFDRSGNRLGHGKGYYDRYLGRCGENVFLIGIAYDFQVLDTIPADAHDIKMNMIVTESRTYHTSL